MTTAALFGQGQVVMNASSAGTYLKFTNCMTLANFTGTELNIGLYWGTSVNDLATGGGTLATFADMNGTPAGAGTYPGVANLSDTGLLNTTSGGGIRFISMSQAGVTTYFQLRAWTGAYATYEDAIASGLASVLTSHLGDAPIVGFAPTANILPSPIPSNIPWPGGATSASAVLIKFYTIPEPSTFALVGLGLFGLYFIRRRK